MLLIETKFLSAAKNAGSASHLHDLLQRALRLEHSTIPPYLTAAYSIHRNANTEIFRTLEEIAEEEMLHMAMVGNVLNAIGGTPNIADPNFTPQYPGPLPMSISNGLVVGLKKFTPALVKDVFMEIEKPETPLNFPVIPLAADDQPAFATIGQFYKAIIEKIIDLGDPLFATPSNPQVTVNRPGLWQRLKPITGVVDAVAALEWIVQDGEGTTNEPFDGSGEFAHYYRFAEVYHGRRLIQDNSPLGFSYGGAAIPFVASKVYDLPDNPKASDYAVGTDARQLVDEFNMLYSDMLRALHLAFNGEPNKIARAQTLMVQMRTSAVDVVSFVDPNTNKQAGLTFEYMPALTS
ncbi:MAG: ferritin-like protein [Xanthobacteraceae bacterium]|nr:ferritin-like protein [Xanthobacteraceae bacterium]